MDPTTSKEPKTLKIPSATIQAAMYGERVHFALGNDHAKVNTTENEERDFCPLDLTK